ncbi:hypothetical protein OPQ81_006107 [Rhizoctonia solani]|nr:hypothetical protein OPQ81_006107 [Rhizoctonia solani]
MATISNFVAQCDSHPKPSTGRDAVLNGLHNGAQPINQLPIEILASILLTVKDMQGNLQAYNFMWIQDIATACADQFPH